MDLFGFLKLMIVLSRPDCCFQRPLLFCLACSTPLCSPALKSTPKLTSETSYWPAHWARLSIAMRTISSLVPAIQNFFIANVELKSLEKRYIRNASANAMLHAHLNMSAQRSFRLKSSTWTA
eukprot:2554912-Pyramimonas_sp.AAC.2